MKNWLLFFRQKSLVVAISVLAVLGFVFMNVQPAWSEVTQTAVVVTTASDYSSGAHSVVTVDPVGGPRVAQNNLCLLYTSPSPRDRQKSRMPSSA